MRLVLTSFTAAATLGLAACGSDSSSTAPAREGVSPATARREVAATRTALNEALATYRGGDRAAAADQVGEAYVSHFEEVEGPLEDRDDTLKESLEHAIGGELRASMKAGRPVRVVEAQVRAIVADLDTAEAALR
jgi:hypothetical protein